MSERVLIAYASKYGATAEIAEKIAETLRADGLDVDVKPAHKVRDLAEYTAVIVGSAVYMGRWRRQASNFLRFNEDALATKKVWLFSSGPTAEGDPADVMEGWTFPKNLQPVADRLQPEDVEVFHGSLDTEKLNFFERWIIKNVKSPVGDFRDWDDIADWAGYIADELNGVPPQVTDDDTSTSVNDKNRDKRISDHEDTK